MTARWILAATAVALVGLPACAHWGAPPARPDLSSVPEIQPDYRVEVLRGRLQEYAITFAAEVGLAAMAIEGRTTDPAVRLDALRWRLRAIPEMRKACFRAGPAAALIDAWSLARQMDDLFATGAGRTLFGPFHDEAVTVSRRLVVQMREIGASITVSPEARDQLERKIIDPWIAAHPLQDLSFIRDSPVARFAEYAKVRGGALQSIGTVEEVLLSLSQHASLYLADLPRQVRGEIQLAGTDLFPPGMLPALQRDLHLAASAADRVASTTETVPALVKSERQAVLDEIMRQRELVMDGITGEREAVITALTRVIASERDIVVRLVEVERQAMLEWATGERREVIGALRDEMAGAIAAFRVERQAAFDDVGRLIDTALLRVALFVVLALVVAPLVAHLYVRIWPRSRRRDP